MLQETSLPATFPEALTLIAAESTFLARIDSFAKPEIDSSERRRAHLSVGKNFTRSSLANAQTIVRILRNFCRSLEVLSGCGQHTAIPQMSAIEPRPRSTGQGITHEHQPSRY